MMQPYYTAIEFAAERAPSLDSPTKFIVWAEGVAELLRFSYSKDYDSVAADLYNAVRRVQGVCDD